MFEISHIGYYFHILAEHEFHNEHRYAYQIRRPHFASSSLFSFPLFSQPDPPDSLLEIPSSLEMQLEHLEHNLILPYHYIYFYMLSHSQYAIFYRNVYIKMSFPRTRAEFWFRSWLAQDLSKFWSVWNRECPLCSPLFYLFSLQNGHFK